MKELIKLLNDAPLNCGDCEHSVFERDPYGTGDSPDAYYCDTGCEYLNARDELADEYVNAEYSLSDIDENSEEFEKNVLLMIEDVENFHSTEEIEEQENIVEQLMWKLQEAEDKLEMLRNKAKDSADLINLIRNLDRASEDLKSKAKGDPWEYRLMQTVELAERTANDAYEMRQR